MTELFFQNDQKYNPKILFSFLECLTLEKASMATSTMYSWAVQQQTQCIYCWVGMWKNGRWIQNN